MTESIASRMGRVAIIGGGNMGQAICGGLLGIEGVDPSRITVANPGAEKREHISRTMGVRTVANNADALPADLIILAVKPAYVAQVASELKEAGIGAASVVSVAAGVSTQSLTQALGGCTQVVRVMPNTSLTIGCGMSGISGGQQATPELVDLVQQIFSHMGGAVVVAEEHQDVVTAISGSGPAYFELFVQAMAQEGQSLGLSYGAAQELALQTMLGTAQMIKETGQSLDDAIKAVSSPGGTTVAALDAMRAAGVPQGIAAGVAAAAARSKELGA